MAKSLKTTGMIELQRLLRRVNRQEALKRIGEKDAAFLKTRLKECEAKIVTMTEYNEQGEEEV